MSNLQLRIVSALVLAAVTLAISWFGGLAFRVLCALIALAIFYEWSRMARGAATGKLWFLPEILILVFSIALVSGQSAYVLLGSMAIIALVTAVVSLVRGAGQWETSGLVYAALSGFSLALLRDGDLSGLVAILFLFAVVWATDIFAYFVGRAVGGPKLAPSISPGKTRSGAVGGAAGGVVAGLIVAWLGGVHDLGVAGIVALALSVVSQAGDLFESWVKRRHGCKDSSHLIPGHGGVMDRVDGLVVAALALYLIGWMTAGADNPAHGLFPA